MGAFAAREFIRFATREVKDDRSLTRIPDDPPKLPAVKVTKDQDYCGEALPTETYVIDSNGGLKNVVGKRRLSCRPRFMT